MSILKLKEFGSRFILLCVLLSCQNCALVDAKKNVIEISTAVPVEDSGYVYSNESLLKVNNDVFSLRSKAYYGRDGELTKLIVYKPEGRIEYQPSELISDTNILTNVGLPRNQSLVYLHDSLKNAKGEIISFEKISDDLLKSSLGGIVMIYRIK